MLVGKLVAQHDESERGHIERKKHLVEDFTVVVAVAVRVLVVGLHQLDADGKSNAVVVEGQRGAQPSTRPVQTVFHI